MDTYYHMIFAKNYTRNAAAYVESLVRPMERWYGNQPHTVWLLDDNNRLTSIPKLVPGLSKGIFNACFPSSPDLSPWDS